MLFKISLIVIIIFHMFNNIMGFPLLEECEILDMSHDYSNETVVWGTRDPFRLDAYFKGYTIMKYYFKSFKISGAEHAGTHLDAPAHFSEGGLSTDEVPLKNLIGEACVVDVSDKVRSNRDYEMTIEDIEIWEKHNGVFDQKCILIMRTGWEEKYENKKEYFGTQTPLDTKTYHFPGLSPKTAKWLADTGRLKAFGTDTPSQDAGVSTDFGTHRILLPKNIPGMENLMNLSKLPNRGATIVAMPMKIKGGSGGPLRVFAIGWNGPNDPCRRSKP